MYQGRMGVKFMIYDNFNFSPYLIIQDIGRPLLPPRRITDKSIFGKSGSYFFGVQHEPIEIPVKVSFYEDIQLTYREKTRLIAGRLNKTEPKQLIFEDEPNVYINGIIRDSTDIDNLIRAGTSVLRFYCPDPFYYEIVDEVFTFNEVGTYDIEREKGNIESLPTIEIRGVNHGGEIIIETDTTKITFNGLLDEGEVLVFDSKFITSYIIETNGERRSGNNDIDTMIFPYLIVGPNRLKVSTNGNAVVNEIKVYANSRWV
jgi:predicted phage tail component-like protein